MPASKVIVEFDKCCWCGSTQRLSDHILGLARAKGQVSPGYRWYVSQNQLQPPIDPTRPPPLIGSILPTALILNDLCLGCGRTYPVKIVDTEAQVLDTRLEGVQGPATR